MEWLATLDQVWDLQKDETLSMGSTTWESTMSLGNDFNRPRKHRGWEYAFARVKRINGEVDGRTTTTVATTHGGCG